MSRTIHGSSFKTLALFRKQSAALEVYWVYVARANNESVAWPSARQLGVDTGWNKDTCLRARKWLVEHGALGRVEKYTQPKWRKLESAAIQNLINLDRAEYYRPTGTITVDGETHILLYVPTGNEGEDLSKNEPDVRPHRTTTPPDIRPRRIELDSTPVLDSSKDSASTPPVAKRVSLHIALIDAYWHSLPAKPPGDSYSRHVKKAVALCEGGVTPADVVRYMKALYADDFWRGKNISLEYIWKNIGAWLKVNAPKPPAPQIEPLTAEQLAEDTARQFGVGS